MEYTKGTWQIVTKNVPAQTKRIVVNGDPIADIWQGHDNDACLMVASPDMYQAIQSMLEWFGDYDCPQTREGKAALAKAEGK